MKKLLTLIALGALVAGVALAELPAEKVQELQANGRDAAAWTPGQNAGSTAFASIDPIAAPRAPEAPADTQTMTYDSGAITALPTIFGQMYGNRFSQGIGGVNLATITLNSFSFYFAEDSVADTDLFFGPASPGATAAVIHARASVNIGGLVNNGSAFSMLTTINVVPQSALGTTGMFVDTFWLGGWCLNANATVPVDNEALGLDLGGHNPPKGYTAASGGATASVAWAAQPFNAILRANVTSPNLVPVELMGFEVAD